MKEFETFMEIGPYEQRKLTQFDPSCDNNLRIRKYRVTVELVDEPIELIRDRIRKLWREKTHHHTGILLRAAIEYGIEEDLK